MVERMLLFKPNEFKNFIEFIQAYGKKDKNLSLEENLHEACKNLLNAKEKDPNLPGTIICNPREEDLSRYSVKIDLFLIGL